MFAFRNPVPMNEVLFDKDVGSMFIDLWLSSLRWPGTWRHSGLSAAWSRISRFLLCGCPWGGHVSIFGGLHGDIHTISFNGTWVASSNLASALPLNFLDCGMGREGRWKGHQYYPILLELSSMNQEIHIIYIFMIYEWWWNIMTFFNGKQKTSYKMISLVSYGGMAFRDSQVKSLESVKQLISWKATMCSWKWSFDCRSWRLNV